MKHTKSVHELIRERLLAQAGCLNEPKHPFYTLQQLQKSEWSEEFEQLMRNRLVMGAMRYGTINAASKPDWRRIQSTIRRLQLFLRDGNLEHLVDAANLCLLEFVRGNHPLRHFHSNDNTREHITT